MPTKLRRGPQHRQPARYVARPGETPKTLAEAVSAINCVGIAQADHHHRITREYLTTLVAAVERWPACRPMAAALVARLTEALAAPETRGDHIAALRAYSTADAATDAATTIYATAPTRDNAQRLVRAIRAERDRGREIAGLLTADQLVCE